MRTLLALVRANQTAVHAAWPICRPLLVRVASARLTVLDPERGDKELIEGLAAEVVKLAVRGLAAEFVAWMAHEPV